MASQGMTFYFCVAVIMLQLISRSSGQLCVPGQQCTEGDPSRPMEGCASFCQCVGVAPADGGGFAWSEAHNCPANLLFSVATGNCNYPQYVECPEA